MRYRFFIARKLALTVCLLLIALWAPASSARRTAADRAASPVSINGPDVSTFLIWEEVQGKTPLVEPVPGDDQLRRVTFLWRGGAEASQVTLNGQIPPDSQDAPLMRLANTDVWFLTLRLPATARFTYGFKRPGKRQILDPLNPLRFRSSSFAELPAAPPQSWTVIQPDVPKGTLSYEKLRSENLKEERSVAIYTPPGYDPKNGSYGLLVLFDGQDYRGPMPIPTILDNLVAAKKIRPLVAILVDNQSEEARDRDLECYPPFADCLASGRRESRWPQRRILCAPLSGSFRQRPITVGRVRLFSGLGRSRSQRLFSIRVVDSAVRDDAEIAHQILSGSRIVRERLSGHPTGSKPSHARCFGGQRVLGRLFGVCRRS